MLLEDFKGLIASRKMINKQGMYQLKVSNVTEYGDRMIVNFNAMTRGHVNGYDKTDPDTGEVTTVPSMKELIADGTPEAIQEAANRNISSGQRIGKDYVPKKGEFVNVMMEQQTTKAGVTGLFVSAITAVPVVVASAFNADSLFDDEEEYEEEEAEESAEEAVATIKKVVKKKK